MQTCQVNFTFWPFKYINGQQTPESKALEGDKSQHKPEQPNIDDLGDAPW